MLRVTRLTDYGIVLMGRLARGARVRKMSTRDLAVEVGLPQTTVGKILKTLARSGLLVSHRGAQGGYSLARTPSEITVAEIVRAIEGPIALTQGSIDGARDCPIGANWQLIDAAVRRALRGVTLFEMMTRARFDDGEIL